MSDDSNKEATNSSEDKPARPETINERPETIEVKLSEDSERIDRLGETEGSTVERFQSPDDGVEDGNG